MKKVDVLLLSPFLIIQSDDPSNISPPLSLAYIAAYLEKKRVKVSILDIAAEGIEIVKKIGKKTRFGLTNKEIIQRVKNSGAKIVGITCASTLHAKEAHLLAVLVKKADANILLVMGGAHPSVAPSQVLQDKNIDMVVRGEGEITFWEIYKKYQKGKIPKNILGTSICQGKKIINYSNRPLIKNLDDLPFPARHLLPMQTYLKYSKGTYLMRQPAMALISSRGCPGNCVYCSVKTIWGRVWRARSAKNVVDEIEVLINDFGAREIHFMDDSVSVNKKRLRQICQEIIKRKLDIKWTTPNGIAIWLLDKKLIKKMKQAGCYRLTFGFESGNKDVLNKYIGKFYDYNKAKNIVTYASKIGLWTAATFILGFPYETKEQIEDTINFAISTDLDMAVFFLANPFPGTKMFTDFQKEGLLPKNIQNIVRGCKTKHFTHRQLLSIQAEAFSRFMRSRFKKPWRFLYKIKSIDDIIYTSKLANNLTKLMIKQNLIKNKGIAALWK